MKIFAILSLALGSTLILGSAHASVGDTYFFTWGSNAQGYNSCFVSDSSGKTPAGTTASPNECCPGASIDETFAYTWGSNAQGYNSCFASDSSGNTPAGSPASPSECCPGN